MEERMNRLTNFVKDGKSSVVTTSEELYRSPASSFLGNDKKRPVEQYTKEEVQEMIRSGSPEELKELSNNFFYTSGFYKRLVTNYATLLYYTPLVIPHIVGKDKTFTKKMDKAYDDVTSFLSKFNFEKLCNNFAYKVLLDGEYYGMVKTDGKNYSIQDLPYKYCRTRTATLDGTDIVEFDIRWFFTITDNELREETVKSFPAQVQSIYNGLTKDWRKAYKKNKQAKPTYPKNCVWVPLAQEQGVHFQLFENKPFFAMTIPHIIDFEDYVTLEKTKDSQTLKSVITQELPHCADGTLVIDPEEAITLHEGLAKIAKNNDNLDAITTYGTIDLKRVQDDEAALKNNLEKISNVLYSEGGVSKSIFSADGNISLNTSIKNDINLMMVLADQFAIWLKNFINITFGNKVIEFGVSILPVGGYNSEDYGKQALSMAQYGYSSLIPSLAMGIAQHDFIDLKNLENNVYKMQDVLIPLRSSHTEDGSGSTDLETENAESEGASKGENISDRTIQNRNSGGET